MNKNNLRTYRSFTKFISDIFTILSENKNIRPLMRGETINSQFRERLMLAVISVNQCRYCSYVHSKLALTKGISSDEIIQLSAGDLENCPKEEQPALFYAQYWAESEGNPQPEIRQRILDIYGEKETLAIELIIRIINTANLIGNTVDLTLYYLSFGRYKVKQNVQETRVKLEHFSS